MAQKSIEFMDNNKSFAYEDRYRTSENSRYAQEIMAASLKLVGGYQNKKPLLPNPGYIDKNNPGYQYCAEEIAEFDEWAGDGSTSTKVEATYKPDEFTLPSNGKTFGKEAVDMLSGAEAAVSLRARKELFEKLLSTFGDTWLSLAAGGGLPVLDAVEKSGRGIDLTVTDYDPAGLRLIKKRVAERGLSDHVTVLHRDLRRNEEGFEHGHLKDKLVTAIGLKHLPYLHEEPIPLNAFDTIEADGFFEYLPFDPAAQLLVNALRHSNRKDGSRLIVSNIVDTHPDREWLHGVAQWTVMKYRGLDEMKQIFEKANDGGAGIKRIKHYKAGEGYLVFEADL